MARLVEELEAGGEDRSVVPVRVFWVPGGLPTRVKIVGLLSGRETYRPPELIQRRILRKDPSRARVVAGEPAKVSELRQQWLEHTTGESPREFARFVLRRASLAIERIELRLLGPEYKSPRLIKHEMLASARFRSGARADPRRHRREGRRDARRTLHRLEPVLGRPDSDNSGGPSSAGASTPTSTTTAPRSSRCGTRSRPTPRCCCSRTGPISTA